MKVKFYSTPIRPSNNNQFSSASKANISFGTLKVGVDVRKNPGKLASVLKDYDLDKPESVIPISDPQQYFSDFAIMRNSFKDTKVNVLIDNSEDITYYYLFAAKKTEEYLEKAIKALGLDVEKIDDYLQE